MPALRLLAACSVAIAACGGPTPAAQPPKQRQQTSSLRFAKPPVAIAHTEFGYLDVWVRLNRPLRHNVGHPAEYTGHDAFLEFEGAGHDIVGMYRDHVYPTCYGESLSMPDRTFAAGEEITVTLVLGEDEQISTTARVQLSEGSDQLRARRELRCPTRVPGVLPARRCRGSVPAPYVGGISLVSATGASCRTARAVMRSVGRWAHARCWEDLCVSSHPWNRGFRCRAALAGEAAWEIQCRRGDKVVRGYTAE